MFVFYVNISTEFIYRGCEINKRSEIWENYKKSSFLYDLISLTPLLYNFYDKSNCVSTYLMELPIFLKYYSFSNTYEKIINI